MDYETILQAIGEDPEYLYKTERGSAYAHYADNSTVRNRSSANHRDPTEGLQPRSGKTVYMSPQDVDRVAGLFQNAELGTEFKPVGYDKDSKTGTANLSLTDDYGPKKAGTTLHSAPFTTVPTKGMIPVEINKSESPIGSSGRGIHWGTKITEVIPRGTGGGGMGGAGPRGGGAAGVLQQLNPNRLNFAQGGIAMPDGYRAGGNWKLI